MTSNGSIYVSVVFALLVGYFSYQWWFNQNRVVKRRLGELAATLSVPASEADLERVAQARAAPPVSGGRRPGHTRAGRALSSRRATP